MTMLGSINRRNAVTDTSAAVYREEQPAMDFRARTVLGWLESFGVNEDLTSGELAEAVTGYAPVLTKDPTARLLFVRRGLSELKAAGRAVHGEPRVCLVTKRICVTWRASNDDRLQSRLAPVRDTGLRPSGDVSLPLRERPASDVRLVATDAEGVSDSVKK